MKWYTLGQKKPEPSKKIEVCLNGKTFETSTLSHHGKTMIRTDGENGFFRAKFVEDFDDNLKWREKHG
jgi:hypothetical protein